MHFKSLKRLAGLSTFLILLPVAGHAHDDSQNAVETTSILSPWVITHSLLQNELILAAAYQTTSDGSLGGVQLARYTASGLLDPAFGSFGQTPLAVAATVAIAQPLGLAMTRVPIQKAHKKSRNQTPMMVREEDRIILLAGYTTPIESGMEQGIIISRFLPNGKTDEDFGTKGISRIPLSRLPQPGNATFRILQDGRMILASADYQGENQADEIRLHVFSTTGDLLHSSLINGASLPLKPLPSSISSLSLDDQGRLTAVGHEITVGKLVIARFLVDGRPDEGFGIQGFVSTRYDESVRIDHVTSTSRGLILSGTRQAERLFVLNLDERGQPDPLFRQGLVKKINFGVKEALVSNPRAFVGEGGKIIITGNYYGEGISSGVPSFFVRLESDGKVDKTFGTKGLVALLPSQSGNAPLAMATEPFLLSTLHQLVDDSLVQGLGPLVAAVGQRPLL